MIAAACRVSSILLPLSPAPIPTFEPGDRYGGLRELNRMVSLAGSPDRVVPGPDALVFARFPTRGRIAGTK